MSQHDKNIVRDRTLVLRVLVPGLHTSLNDKIASKQEGEGPPAPSPSPPPSASASADQVLNLDGVTCLPSKKGDSLWHFRCDGATYPARLVNLPCPVEVHKTFDHTNYHKSADVGQMLIVYEDEYAMEEAENEKGYRVDGFPSYYHSGLTPPMRKVVQRRYLSRFEERDTKPAPPPKREVSEVEKELQGLIAKLGAGKGGKGKPKGRGASSSAPGKGKEIKVVEEEVVDYEPWMGEGGVFTVDEAKMHPECWLTKAEMKEIDATKKVLQEEQRAKEREAAEEEQKRQEEERKKMEEKAEKKKRKKEKKKKKQQEEAEASPSPSNEGKRKGIPSLKNREGGGADLAAATAAAAAALTAEGEGGEMDDVTAAALANINGQDDLQEQEEFLLNDEMFDFENDDITNLLG